MTKQEIKLLDEFVLKIGKTKGEAYKNHETGAFEVLIKKSELIREINEFIKKMKGLQ